jgi:1-phosphofructokinase
VIITLTPNPSVDRTVTVDAVALGAVNRATAVRVDPGGKGVNVSRALAAHGTATTAVLPVGGPEGRVLTTLLDEAGIAVRAVAIGATTRANLSIVEPDGTTTKINEPGPRLTDREQDRLIDAALDALGAAEWLVASGSLPPGVGADFYARLVRTAHGRGVRVAVDTTSRPLLLAAGAGADLLKPNDEELAAALGRTLVTLGDVRAAADELRAGGTQVIVSLGARGALLVDDGGAVLAGAAQDSRRTPVSTVGAGDSLLAGYLHAGTRDAAALAVGVAWGTAAVALPGSQVPSPVDVDGIDVELAEPRASLVLASAL